MAQSTPTIERVGRIANRVKRQAIARVPPLRQMVQGQHARRLRRHRGDLPALAPHLEPILHRLEQDAIAVVHLDDFAIPSTPAVQAELERLTELLAAVANPSSSTVRPPREELLRDVTLWRWGLDEAMLDLAENYLGQPARYYGADVRREIADGSPHDVRQWHRDIEDVRVLKILVWLNDVAADGGPFAHIPAGRSLEAVQAHRYVAGFVSDERMRAVAPESEWLLRTGPRWTAVMPDTARLFHRATPPVARDRYSVTFTWTSRHPVKTIWQEPYAPEQIRRITEGLTPRQLAALPRSFGR